MEPDEIKRQILTLESTYPHIVHYEKTLLATFIKENPSFFDEEGEMKSNFDNYEKLEKNFDLNKFVAKIIKEKGPSLRFNPFFCIGPFSPLDGFADAFIFSFVFQSTR